MKKQQIIEGDGSFHIVEKIIKEVGAKKIFCICGKSFYESLFYKKVFCEKTFYSNVLKEEPNKITEKFVFFSEFSANPCLTEVWKAKEIFCEEHCDMLLAIGGGSSIDTAKCVKAFYNMNSIDDCLTKTITLNDIKLLAVPTTAGSGSESTHFAVVYYNGEKKSVKDISLLPDYVVLEPELLKSLPRYQRIATMFDAMCQAIESMWSVKSTKESADIAKKALSMIMKSYKGYIENIEEYNKAMQIAANLSGQAINITQTTAPHAMSYKLSSILNIAHGHAVALCLPKVWNYMIKAMDKCVDKKGEEYLKEVFLNIADAMGKKSVQDAIELFESLLTEYDLRLNTKIPNDMIKELVKSVNIERLKNNPIKIEYYNLYRIYSEL